MEAEANNISRYSDLGQEIHTVFVVSADRQRCFVEFFVVDPANAGDQEDRWKG